MRTYNILRDIRIRKEGRAGRPPAPPSGEQSEQEPPGFTLVDRASQVASARKE